MYKSSVLAFAFVNAVNIFIHTILCDCLLTAVLHVTASYQLRPLPFAESPQEEKFVEPKIF
jgi:hypothetical protein